MRLSFALSAFALAAAVPVHTSLEDLRAAAVLENAAESQPDADATQQPTSSSPEACR